MATVREELHRLVDSLPLPLVEELAAVARQLQQQTTSETEDVTDPDEVTIVERALRGDAEPEYTVEEVKAYLAERRRQRMS